MITWNKCAKQANAVLVLWPGAECLSRVEQQVAASHAAENGGRRSAPIHFTETSKQPSEVIALWSQLSLPRWEMPL